MCEDRNALGEVAAPSKRLASRAGAAKGRRMTDTLPDRLSINPKSPWFNQDVLARGVGIRFKGVEKRNVEEYCISEGWIRVAVGKTLDRKGNPLTIKLSGEVEPYFETPAPDAGEAAAEETPPSAD
jgi:hypothetical protein